MSNKTLYAVTALAALALGAAGGFVSSRVMAADASALPDEVDIGGGAPMRVLIENNKLRVNLISFPKGFSRSGGSKRRLDQLIVYLEPGDFSTGGGAPRPPGAQANNSGPKHGEPVKCDVIRDCGPVDVNGNAFSQSASGKPLPVGTVAWHPKGSNVGTIVTKAAYKALYIELK